MFNSFQQISFGQQLIYLYQREHLRKRCGSNRFLSWVANMSTKASSTSLCYRPEWNLSYEIPNNECNHRTGLKNLQGWHSRGYKWERVGNEAYEGNVGGVVYRFNKAHSGPKDVAPSGHAHYKERSDIMHEWTPEATWREILFYGGCLVCRMLAIMPYSIKISWAGLLFSDISTGPSPLGYG